MPDALPASIPHLVIGAGVHGLSTAWHLAERGEDVLVVDKTGVAAGASGIACGVVRNNYFQPAMSELMAACVEIWESDPEALHYHGSGYVALGPERAGVRPRRRSPSARSASATRPSSSSASARSPRTCARCTPTGVRRGPDRVPARARRRLRLQPRVDARAGRQGPRGRRADRHGRRGHRLRVRRRRRGDGRAHESRARSPSSRSSSRSGRGSPGCGSMLGLPAQLDVHRAGRQRRPRPADVDLLVPAGGRGRGRPGERS